MRSQIVQKLEGQKKQMIENLLDAKILPNTFMYSELLDVQGYFLTYN